MVTTEQLAARLAALKHALGRSEHRAEVWRVLVDANGNELKRIYRGSFCDTRGKEPHNDEEVNT